MLHYKRQHRQVTGFLDESDARFIWVSMAKWPLFNQWHHNEQGGVWNHRRIDCSLNRLFKRGSKKTSKPHLNGLYEGNTRVTAGFPSQRHSNAAENISIWWRHYDITASYGHIMSAQFPHNRQLVHICDAYEDVITWNLFRIVVSSWGQFTGDPEYSRHKGLVMRSFAVLFLVSWSKLLKQTQSCCRWIETEWRSRDLPGFLRPYFLKQIIDIL